MSGGLATLTGTDTKEHKLLDLAVLRHGAQDFLSFVDDTEEVLFAYIYHRTGSLESALALIDDVYLQLLSRALSLWWIGSLTLGLALQYADKLITGVSAQADIDTVYLPGTYWMPPNVKKAISSLHEVLWTLPTDDQHTLVLALLLGFTPQKIAETDGIPLLAAQKAMASAMATLRERWDPPVEVESHLQSLVFMPGLNLPREIAMREKIIQKYNALRMRRFQWVTIGVFLAIFSNFIVASVVAFAVSIQPTTRDVSSQIASLEALQHETEFNQYVARSAVQTLQKETKPLVAYNAARSLNDIALSAARLAVDQEQKQEQSLRQQIQKLAFAIMWVAKGILVGWL